MVERFRRDKSHLSNTSRYYRFNVVRGLEDIGLEESKRKEIAADEQAGLVRFLHGSDILILDGQYTDEEHKNHIGWGHSSISSAVSLALEAEIQTLVLFHHDPHHDDEKVDAMLESARNLAARSGKPLKVEAAQEGAEILLEAKVAS